MSHESSVYHLRLYIGLTEPKHAESLLYRAYILAPIALTKRKACRASLLWANADGVALFGATCRALRL